MSNLENLYQAILGGKREEAVDATRLALAEGHSPQYIINNGMVQAMHEIGGQFECGRAFLPHLLMSARAMKGALDLLNPLMVGENRRVSAGRVVIGTVKGDLHDIGKNLVASMLEGAGFEVFNLGVDVPNDVFVSAVRDHDADIVCMSALLTTTMGNMKEVVTALTAAGLRNRVKIMVGGAPLSEGFAASIGADGYSANANQAVMLAKNLLGLTK